MSESSVRKICHKCDEAIVGERVTALGYSWHKTHFTCAKCDLQLGGIVFYEHDGKPYCEADHFELFSPKCAGCGQPIVGQIVNALGKTWHAEHFVCEVCRKPFPDGRFRRKEDKVYCIEDHNKLFGTKCAKCNLIIEGSYMSALGKQYHSDCFTCTECGAPFNGHGFYERDQLPYCKQHSRKPPPQPSMSKSPSSSSMGLPSSQSDMSSSLYSKPNLGNLPESRTSLDSPSARDPACVYDDVEGMVRSMSSLSVKSLRETNMPFDNPISIRTSSEPQYDAFSVAATPAGAAAASAAAVTSGAYAAFNPNAPRQPVPVSQSASSIGPGLPPARQADISRSLRPSEDSRSLRHIDEAPSLPMRPGLAETRSLGFDTETPYSSAGNLEESDMTYDVIKDSIKPTSKKRGMGLSLTFRRKR